MRRYERKAAAELLHLDTKKRACFAWPGHRVTGDRSRYTPRTGWQALPVTIDDHSRVGFSRVLPDEIANSACTHLLAAIRHYRSLDVKIKHLRTKPYTPRTNGKAERFIHTLLREWADAYCYPSSAHRANKLAPWIHHYNFHRPHSATRH